MKELFFSFIQLFYLSQPTSQLERATPLYSPEKEWALAVSHLKTGDSHVRSPFPRIFEGVNQAGYLMTTLSLKKLFVVDGEEVLKHLAALVLLNPQGDVIWWHVPFVDNEVTEFPFAYVWNLDRSFYALIQNKKGRYLLGVDSDSWLFMKKKLSDKPQTTPLTELLRVESDLYFTISERLKFRHWRTGFQLFDIERDSLYAFSIESTLFSRVWKGPGKLAKSEVNHLLDNFSKHFPPPLKGLHLEGLSFDSSQRALKARVTHSAEHIEWDLKSQVTRVQRDRKNENRILTRDGRYKVSQIGNQITLSQLNGQTISTLSLSRAIQINMKQLTLFSENPMK